MSVTCTPKRRIALADLKNEFPTALSAQEKEDALHRKPCEENLAYWTEELNNANDDDEKRIRECAAARRFILLSIVPKAEDDAGEILGAVLTEIDMLPKTH